MASDEREGMGAIRVRRAINEGSGNDEELMSDFDRIRRGSRVGL